MGNQLPFVRFADSPVDRSKSTLPPGEALVVGGGEEHPGGAAVAGDDDRAARLGELLQVFRGPGLELPDGDEVFRDVDIPGHIQLLIQL